MSDQSQFFNPQLDRMALSGAGFILPRLTTAQRLGLSVGPNDAGLQLFDTTAGTIQLWTGSAWTSVGGGGGSRRILATTLTFTGVADARPNIQTATPVGSLPDPSTVLPGGVLQSVIYECNSLVDYNISLSYTSIGAINDYRIPIFYEWACGGFGNLFTRTQDSIAGFVTAGGTSSTISQNDYRSFTTTTFPASAFAAWPSVPAEFQIRLGEPNYGRQTNVSGAGSVARNILYNSLQWDGSVSVYYLFA